MTVCTAPNRRCGLLALLVVATLVGCGSQGPPSTDATSAAFASLEDKVDFLERYVTFRRAYESLDFAIRYSNNSGGMTPGPSDWDVRLVAVVPQTEIDAWIPPGASPSTAPAAGTDWLRSVPTTVDLSGLSEWYATDRKLVGIDRSRRIVAYRSWTQ